MEQWKSSTLRSELYLLNKKITKLKEDLKLEHDMNFFDRKIRTKNHDL